MPAPHWQVTEYAHFAFHSVTLHAHVFMNADISGRAVRVLLIGLCSTPGTCDKEHAGLVLMRVLRTDTPARPAYLGVPKGVITHLRKGHYTET